MMNNDTRQIKRKKYFLLDSSQPSLYGKILLLFLVVLLISGTVFYFLSQQEMEMEWYKAHSTLRYVTAMFLPWIIFTDIAGIIIIAAYLVFFTHRIAGASYRIKKDLDIVRRGNLMKRIRLRRKDQLQDVADSLNVTLESLRERIEKIAGTAFEAEMKVNAVLHYLSETDELDTAREESGKLVSIMRRMREDLQSFIS